MVKSILVGLFLKRPIVRDLSGPNIETHWPYSRNTSIHHQEHQGDLVKHTIFSLYYSIILCGYDLYGMLDLNVILIKPILLGLNCEITFGEYQVRELVIGRGSDTLLQ